MRRRRGLSEPEVQLEVNVLSPLVEVGTHYTVRIWAFVRLCVRNPTGAEARLEDPYLLWREVQLFGRHRELARLPLRTNTDDTRRDLSVVVAPYTDSPWQQDLYFMADWPPALKLKGRPRWRIC